MASPRTMCRSCFRAAQQAARITPSTFSKPSNLSRRTYYTSITTPHASTRQISHPSIYQAIPKSYISTPATTHRTLATTATATPTSAPSNPQPARAILHPRTDESGNPMRVFLSPRATNRLAAIATKDSNPNTALRILIESGGCHGFQYVMSLVDLGAEPATEEDTIFEGEKGAKVVIDESSLELLNGSTVDYTMELIGSQFVVTGIPGATSSCGCGTSFDIKI
ncbi:hypothetical protein DM02DRAFT_608927 [Periconia macrospinosa]|uniref:Core domain-containing protein n=1 Tax=Periconia macrospinosa TaxID=97972 RepID=A0A2V1EDP1_9PLEO|nr:hypothetical protein DM02DRAFT_608927 [Periconia macrospinosa]